MPSYPTGISQRTWSTAVSEPITATLLRQNVTSPVWLLSSPPAAILAQQVTALSVPSATLTSVYMDTEILDTTGGHSFTSDPARWFAAVTGWYLIRGVVPYVNAGNNNQYRFNCSFQVFTAAGSVLSSADGGCHGGSSGDFVMPNGAELAVLNAPSTVITNNDYVRMYAYQDTGAARSLAINTPAGVFPAMFARWVGTATGFTKPVPSPATWPDTTQITGAIMNAQVRDTIQFLSFPPMARLTATSTQPIGSQTFPAGTAVTFGSASAFGTSASSDNYGGWSSGTNPSRYTFQRAGRYYAYGQAAYAQANAGAFAAGLRVNGGTTQWGTRVEAPSLSTNPIVVNCEQYLRANAGDYAELIASQNSGASVSTTANSSTTSKLIVLWEGS